MKILQFITLGLWLVILTPLANSQEIFIPQGIEDHIMCNLSYDRQLLTQPEIMACFLQWELIKAQFAEIPQEEIQKLNLEDRAVVMRQAYLNYVDWKAENAALVASLENAIGEQLDAYEAEHSQGQ